MPMKHLLLVSLMVLALCLSASLAEEQTAAWHDGDGEVWNDAGEHFTYEIEEDHAVLTRYWVEKGKPQPPVVEVPAVLGGMPLTAIGDSAFDNFDGIKGPDGYQTPYEGDQVERIVIPEGVTVLYEGAFVCAHSVRRGHRRTALR